MAHLQEAHDLRSEASPPRPRRAPRAASKKGGLPRYVTSGHTYAKNKFATKKQYDAVNGPSQDMWQ